MGGFQHAAAERHDPEDARFATRNARWGLRFFLVYLTPYIVYVLLSAFRPTTLDWKPAANINLAVWYGFFLIGFALFLALLYGWMCRARPNHHGGQEARR